jgi:hypothetical protein
MVGAVLIVIPVVIILVGSVVHALLMVIAMFVTVLVL